MLEVRDKRAVTSAKVLRPEQGLDTLMSGIISQDGIDRRCTLVLSPWKVHERASSPDRISELYDLHDILHLGYGTPSSSSPPPLNQKELASDDSDSSVWLSCEPSERRKKFAEWPCSDTDCDSRSEINLVSLDATGRISRIATIPIAGVPSTPCPEGDFVPLPSDLTGRLQKMQKRAKVEVLHDIRPKRQLTEQEEFMVWMNKDGVRMLLTPASQALLKTWLAEGDAVGPEAPRNVERRPSPVGFRVCVEEDSDTEDEETLSTPEKHDRPEPFYISTHSVRRDSRDGKTRDEDWDAGNDADVEDHSSIRRRFEIWH